MTAPVGYFERLAEAVGELVAPAASGRVAEARASRAVVEGLGAPTGAAVRVGLRGGAWVEAEVTAVLPGRIELALLARAEGLRAGAPAELEAPRPLVRVSRGLLGRCVDSLGEPVDGHGPVSGRVPVRLVAEERLALPARPAGGPGLAPGLHALVRARDEREGTHALVRLVASFDGPCVAAVVGGSARSHGEFVEELGSARARTACVLEPFPHPAARSTRAVLTAAAIARFLAQDPGRALLVADWRVARTPPVARAILGRFVAAAWSASAKGAAFDLEIDARSVMEARP